MKTWLKELGRVYCLNIAAFSFSIPVNFKSLILTHYNLTFVAQSTMVKQRSSMFSRGLSNPNRPLEI